MEGLDNRNIRVWWRIQGNGSEQSEKFAALGEMGKKMEGGAMGNDGDSKRVGKVSGWRRKNGWM
jgi:hypothetical protein